MSAAVDTRTEIRSFQVDIPEANIDDLRRRIAATRWPSKELVDDRSQGVQLATLKALADYWTSEYDFDRVGARLNALPQFTTEIDGVDVHFIHVRSEHEDALPGEIRLRRADSRAGSGGRVVDVRRTSTPERPPRTRIERPRRSAASDLPRTR